MKPIVTREAARETERSPARRERAQPLQGRVAQTSEDVSRVLVVNIISYLSRLERERRALYGSDLELATVFEVVSVAALEPVMRAPGFRAAYDNYQAIVGIEGQRGINAMSIAASTGIPRETVRRKLKRLVERGYIVEKTKGHYVVTPGRLQGADYQAAFARGIRETIRFINECFEQGLIHWVPNSDPPKGSGNR